MPSERVAADSRQVKTDWFRKISEIYRSPSFFQNILRNIPGVQDYLAGMLPSPKVDVKALEGRYMWVSKITFWLIIDHMDEHTHTHTNAKLKCISCREISKL